MCLNLYRGNYIDIDIWQDMYEGIYEEYMHVGLCIMGIYGLYVYCYI